MICATHFLFRVWTFWTPFLRFENFLSPPVFMNAPLKWFQGCLYTLKRWFLQHHKTNVIAQLSEHLVHKITTACIFCHVTRTTPSHFLCVIIMHIWDKKLCFKMIKSKQVHHILCVMVSAIFCSCWTFYNSVNWYLFAKCQRARWKIFLTNETYISLSSRQVDSKWLQNHKTEKGCLWSLPFIKCLME